LIPFLIFQASRCYSQNTIDVSRHSQTVSDYGDCGTAKTISLTRSLALFCKAPLGFGAKKEIKANANNKFVFKEEHNVNWFKFKTKYEGTITMDIVPEDSTNDYDFVIFRGDSSSFCEQFVAEKRSPVCSNISRLDKSISGRTGLAEQSQSALVSEGPGFAYSEALKVHPNEWYYLAIDNVYPNGKGYQLFINYLKTVTISGTIKGSDSTLLKASYILTDQFGATVLSSETTNGKFEFAVPLKENQNYDLRTESEGHFFDSKIINTSSIKSLKAKININAVLPQLKGGKKYAISTINFLPDSPELFIASLPALKALCKILKKNPTMVVEVGGHVNGCIELPGVEIQKLSEKRAQTVVNYCINHGIAAERLKAVGYGCKGMVFSNARTEYEQRMNRRVEINIIKL
jgi:outer membrane protein OmpA-like peptidoglycan-associated protein